MIALQEAYQHQDTANKASAILALVGTVNIPIIYKSVDWWYTLHQGASIKFSGESAIHSSMLYPLLLNIVAFYALYACVVLLNMRAQVEVDHRHTRWLVEQLGDD